MAPLDADKTLKSLLKKGFQKSMYKSNDHIWVDFWHEGKLTRIKTKLSHNHQELNNFLIKQMSKQTYMNTKQFIAFAKCDLSEQDYIEILKAQQII